MANPTTKVRSPNYPMFDLEDAVARVKVVYENMRMHPAPRDAVAAALGYKSLNGTSLGAISALTKYGLLESVGDQLKVSEDARDILLHHRGERPRADAIRRAALLPALFNELHEKYGDDPPSDHLLIVYLTKRGFNPNTLPGVIRLYRDTMTFVTEESIGSDEGFDDNQEAEDPMAAPAAPRADSNRGSATASGMAPEPGWATSRELRFTLLDGAEVRALFQGPVTQDSIEMFKELLNISKRGFPVSAAASTASADTDDEANM